MKYRIVEKNGKFYPQELSLGFFWVGFTRGLCGECGNVYFLTLDEARKFLEAESLEKNPIVEIHPYP